MQGPLNVKIVKIMLKFISKFCSSVEIFMLKSFHDHSLDVFVLLPVYRGIWVQDFVDSESCGFWGKQSCYRDLALDITVRTQTKGKQLI